ncbi:hypothetical protein GCM10017750_60650 [Streptomyces racemochromogenes]
MGQDPVESVAQALGVGRGALGGGAQAEGGADDGVPAAERGAEFGLGSAGELGLDELAGDVEGLALFLFAAAGGEEGAGAGEGAAAHFGEQGGLAEARRAREGEEAAAGVGAGSGEPVQRLVHGEEFGFAFEERAPRAGPAFRHGSYPPGRLGRSAYARARADGSHYRERIRSSVPGGGFGRPPGGAPGRRAGRAGFASAHGGLRGGAGRPSAGGPGSGRRPPGRPGVPWRPPAPGVRGALRPPLTGGVRCVTVRDGPGGSGAVRVWGGRSWTAAG